METRRTGNVLATHSLLSFLLPLGNAMNGNARRRKMIKKVTNKYVLNKMI